MYLFHIYEEIHQTVTLFVSQNWQKFLLGAHLFDTVFFNRYTLYYTRKQLNNRKRSCDTVLGKNGKMADFLISIDILYRYTEDLGWYTFRGLRFY